MKCIIPSQNVKIVARAVHSLSKIGDDLYIEPTNNDLIFRSISSAQSALCEFKMCKSFFSSYSFTVDDGDVKCKVAMKSCLGVFKNPHCADKQVESCEIRFKSEGTVVIFYIKYTNASTKKFFLPVIDSEKVEINYEKECPNRVVASSKLLASSFKNFRSNEDEITVKVSADKIVIKNHLEPGRDKGLMRTEMNFQPSEFECCSITSPTAVTFTLKEMRAAINFAEPGNLPVQINITKPGDPLIIKTSFQPAYESTYIIATLKVSRMDLEASSHITQASSVSSRQCTSRPAQQTPKPNSSRVNNSFNDPGPSTSRVKSLPEYQINEANLSIANHEPINEVPVQSENVPMLSSSIPEIQEPHKSLVQTTLFNCPSKLFTTEQPMEVDESTNINVELLRLVFRRCFTKNFIFDTLPGNEIILGESSDSN